MLVSTNSVLGRVVGDRLGLAAAILLLAFLLVGALAPYLPFGDPEAIGAGERLMAPNRQFLLGTDELGRDFLPRVLGGISTTFFISSVAVLIMAVLGTLIGIAAAYYGGTFDAIVARLADVLFAFPALVFGLLISAIVGMGNTAAIIVIVLDTLPRFVRVIRGVTLSIVERDFVVSSVIAGGSSLRAMLVHILPNIMGVALIQLTFSLSVGMLIESGLSFLGFGVQPPAASLGSLLQLGTVYLTTAPWLALVPGLMLALCIGSVQLLGDTLRDALEPLRGRELQ
ncbi:MAG TPA: ABC transporter permease [Ramlibacter sp.]|jgi:peptide/nickel transport system permease protein|nr:ABC transporter permease [Ramlibacter sp.]